MNIILFYRSREVTSKIASSTMDKYYKQKIPNLHILDFNLDKKNYEKYLAAQQILPNAVFVSDDEDILIDFLIANYSTIQIERFNTKEVRPFELKGGYYNQYKDYNIKLFEKILEYMDNKEEKNKYYQIERLKINYRTCISIEERFLNDKQVSEIKRKKDLLLFNSLNEANLWIEECYNKKMIECNEKIEESKKAIEKYKKTMKDVRKLLKVHEINKEIKKEELEGNI